MLLSHRPLPLLQLLRGLLPLLLEAGELWQLRPKQRGRCCNDVEAKEN